MRYNRGEAFIRVLLDKTLTELKQSAGEHVFSGMLKADIGARTRVTLSPIRFQVRFSEIVDAVRGVCWDADVDISELRGTTVTYQVDVDPRADLVVIRAAPSMLSVPLLRSIPYLATSFGAPLDRIDQNKPLPSYYDYEQGSQEKVADLVQALKGQRPRGRAILGTLRFPCLFCGSSAHTSPQCSVPPPLEAKTPEPAPQETPAPAEARPEPLPAEAPEPEKPKPEPKPDELPVLKVGPSLLAKRKAAEEARARAEAAALAEPPETPASEVPAPAAPPEPGVTQVTAQPEPLPPEQPPTPAQYPAASPEQYPPPAQTPASVVPQKGPSLVDRVRRMGKPAGIGLGVVLALLVGVAIIWAVVSGLRSLVLDQDGTPAATEAPEMPDIIARSRWQPSFEPGSGYQRLDVEYITVVHSGTAYPSVPIPRYLEDLAAYEIGTLGYVDLDAHFYVDRTGAIYAGRPLRAVGEIGLFDETGHVIIHAIGNYRDEQPTDEMLDALVDLVAWLAVEYLSLIHI